MAITGTTTAATVVVDDGDPRILQAVTEKDFVHLVIDGLRESMTFARSGSATWISSSRGTWRVDRIAEPSVREDDAHSGDAEILSPMPGSIIAIGATTGSAVTAGTAIVVVEAMKMEHTLTTPIDGTVELTVAVGDQVRVDQILARIVPTDPEEDQP